MFNTVCVDLDGTLLRTDNTISEISIRELKRLSNQGISIMIASGRHYTEITQLLEPTRLKVDFVISSDGLYIYTFNGVRIHTTHYLSMSDVSEVLTCVGGNSVYFYTKNKNYCAHSKLKYLLKGIWQTVIHKDNVCHILFTLKHIDSIEKIAVEPYFPKPNHLSVDYNAIISVPHRLEVTHKECNKYNAIMWLNSCGIIDVTSMLYFGDSFNDEECFMKLPNAVVMENAPEPLHKYSNLIAESNDADGVAKMLRILIPDEKLHS